MMIRAEAAGRTHRHADHRPRLFIPRTMTVRTRAYVDRILERGRNRPIIFRRHEQNRVGRPDLLAERNPLRGRALVVVLVVKWKLSNLDNFELKPRGRKRRERLGGHAIVRAFAKTPDDYRYLSRRAHRILASPHSPLLRCSYEIEYAADRARRIGSAESSIPSVMLPGSNTKRRSSAALVGEMPVTSSRPSSTTGRSAGHKLVTSSVGSPSRATCKRRRNATGPLCRRASSSSRRKFAP